MVFGDYIILQPYFGWLKQAAICRGHHYLQLPTEKHHQCHEADSRWIHAHGELFGNEARHCRRDGRTFSGWDFIGMQQDIDLCVYRYVQVYIYMICIGIYIYDMYRYIYNCNIYIILINYIYILYSHSLTLFDYRIWWFSWWMNQQLRR